MKRLCLLFVLILISGCAAPPLAPPQRLDPLAGLGITLSPVYGDLTAGLILSENTKISFDYGRKGKPWTPDLEKIEASYMDIFRRNFKTVTQIERMEDGRNLQLDIIIVFDLFANVYWQAKFEAKAILLTPEGHEIDTVQGEAVRDFLSFGAKKPIESAALEAASNLEKALRSSFKLAEFAKTRVTADKTVATATTSKPAPGIVNLGSTLEPVSGIYVLEEHFTFNVLDAVVLDPNTGILSLVGHFDENYAGQPIPYLQHLATLLEHPEPEFTLEYLPESKRAVDRLFDQGLQGFKRQIESWGRVIDENNKVTRSGRWLLPLLGIRAVRHGNAIGKLGVSVQSVEIDSPDLTEVPAALRIIGIEKGSAAERAGLRVGDIIRSVDGRDSWLKPVFDRDIRFAGGGAEVKLNGVFSGMSKTITVTLDSEPGDPWGLYQDRYDLIIQLFQAAGMDRGAELIRALLMSRWSSQMDKTQQIAGIWTLARDAGVLKGFQDIVSRGQNREISVEEGTRQFCSLICRGMDSVFGFSGTPTLDAFNRALATHSPTDALTPAFAECDRHLIKIQERALKIVWDRVDIWQAPEGLVHEMLGTRPVVIPHYLGVDPTSQVARVLLEADFVGKNLSHAPELKRVIPRYKTEFEFEYERSGASGRGGALTESCWFSVDDVDLAQPRNGNTLEIRGVKMRINMQQKGSKPDAPQNPYGEFLTSLYDDLARQVPVLHELQECAKLGAVAKWLAKRKPGFRLPKDGRAKWQAPARVPGLLFITWKYPNKDSSVAFTVLSATGGVSLKIKDKPVKELPVEDDLRDAVASKVPRVDGKIVSPGWVSQLSIGDDLRDAVASTPAITSQGLLSPMPSRPANTEAVSLSDIDELPKWNPQQHERRAQNAKKRKDVEEDLDLAKKALQALQMAEGKKEWKEGALRAADQITSQRRGRFVRLLRALGEESPGGPWPPPGEKSFSGEIKQILGEDFSDADIVEQYHRLRDVGEHITGKVRAMMPSAIWQRWKERADEGYERVKWSFDQWMEVRRARKHLEGVSEEECRKALKEFREDVQGIQNKLLEQRDKLLHEPSL